MKNDEKQSSTDENVESKSYNHILVDTEGLDDLDNPKILLNLE